MDELQTVTLSRLIEPTRDAVSLEKCKAALAYARSIGSERGCKIMIVNSRQRWLNYLTITQRKWQRGTTNKNKARHHDSIEIREKYVRCI